MRDFDMWLSQFVPSIANYKYYVDFDKVFNNVELIKIPLNILNSLVGSRNIEEDFKYILHKYPETLQCIPILLAKREYDILVLDNDEQFNFNFKKKNYSIEDYVKFMRETGLFDLLEKHLVCNLLDYVTGVETGLDSNGRKNRGGDLMENLVEHYLKQAGLVRDESYFKEMYIHEIEERWGVNLSAISNKGTTEKRFDFVVKGAKTIYGIETNFYGGGGSKLNETARSYKTITMETRNLGYFKFVWVTDGIGWKSARNNLRETFDVLDDLYCIAELRDGVFNQLFK